MSASAKTKAEIEPVSCHGARAFRAVSACSAPHSAELASIALRPPPGMVVCKFGSRSVVGRYQLSDQSEILLKYYFPKNLARRLSQSLAGSRCLRSWNAAIQLRALGLPVPAPWFVAEWRALGGLWLTQSVLVTSVAPGETLSEWIEAHQDDPARLKAMADRLRHHFALMAEHHIAHGDLKASNLLVAADDSLSFIDLDAAAVDLPRSQWIKARKRDQRIFLANWRPGTKAASAFANIFEQP